MMATYGGRAKMANPPHMQLIGVETIGHHNHKKKLPTRIAGSQRQCATIRHSTPTLRKVTACRSAQLFSVVAAATRCRWFIKRSIGTRAYIWARRWPQKPPQPPPVQEDEYGAIQWRCCHSADTTSALIFSTGSILESSSLIRR